MSAQKRLIEEWREKKGWYTLFTKLQLSGGAWIDYVGFWTATANNDGVRFQWLQRDWDDHGGPPRYIQDFTVIGSWYYMHIVSEDSPEVRQLYEKLRGGRFSPRTISNARLAVLETNPESTMGLAGHRLEMILETGHPRLPSLSGMMWVKWQKNSEGLEIGVPKYVAVRRRITAVRMTDAAGEKVEERVWTAKGQMPNHTNTPYFVEQILEVQGDAVNVLKTRLLGNRGNAWSTSEGAVMNDDSPLSFPGRCSDPDVRTDPFTLEQERTGRTNRMSVADLACLARPFHCRQNQYLKRYLPHGGYVQDAKRRMLEGGMLGPSGVPEGASPLPSLAGLRL